MEDRGFVPVAGGRLYYEVTGEGPPLVLIHAGVANLGNGIRTSRRSPSGTASSATTRGAGDRARASTWSSRTAVT